MNAPVSTPTITERACQAWWLLEAAELRGLPSPRSLAVSDYGTTTLGLEDLDQLNTWAETLDIPIDCHVDSAGNAHHVVEGELHDLPVRVVVVLLAPKATS